MRELHVITDMQFGSTGKGLLAGYLAMTLKPDTVMTAWGPNAGHTFIDAKGRKYVHTMLANGCVSPDLERILIGPGSVINPTALLEDLMNADASLLDKVFIHENAAVANAGHALTESGYGFKIGSTMKGTAQAVIQKLRRDPENMNIARLDPAIMRTKLAQRVVTDVEYMNQYEKSRIVLVEGAQGYSLSLNRGFYPYVTSRDCTTLQVLSDCAVPMEDAKRAYVYGVCRTYPIRVANRFDSTGKMVGTSGPCYDDQDELTWEKLDLPVEYTTVTKLPRRIFSFSQKQVARAIHANGIDAVFLNFCNYVSPDRQAELIAAIEQCGVDVLWTGHGPTINDVNYRRGTIGGHVDAPLVNKIRISED